MIILFILPTETIVVLLVSREQNIISNCSTYIIKPHMKLLIESTWKK